MIIISAMTEDRVIGSGDTMPWSVPKEYEQYLQFVSGNTVVMGRKTYEIFGSDLPESTTIIVITRSASIDNVSKDGAATRGPTVAASLAEALLLANDTGKPVFVAGGGTIYEQALPLADEMLLSTIKGEFEGDAYFPEFNASKWDVLEERDEDDFVFRHYRRK